MPVLSSKQLNAGDVVFRCKPLLFVVNNEFKDKYCNNCLKRSDQLKKCAKCHEMYYCGKDCQINDWKFHKNECKLFRDKWFQRSMLANLIDPSESILLFLRLCLRVKSDPTFATQTHQLLDGSDICLKDIDVLYDRESNPHYLSYKTMITSLYQKFKNIFGIDLDVKEFCKWYVLIDQNCITLSYYSEESIFFFDAIVTSIVLGLKSIKHSCLPNTSFIAKGLSVEIRAMKSISTGDEITTSHIPLFMNRMDRREALRTIGMDCNCSKCRLHLDKDIDYQEIKTLTDKHIDKWKYYEVLNLMNSPFLGLMNVSYEMDTKYLMYLKEVFGEFNPQISYYLFKSFICLSINSRSATKSMLKLWYTEVETHILVTHGSDHPCLNLLRKYNPN